MAGYYDPFGRSRPQQRRTPTLDDYQSLLQAYKKLEQQQRDMESAASRYQEQAAGDAKRVKQLEQELDIKSEAMTRQSEALKELESELIWTRAALKQQGTAEDQAESDEEGTWKERFQRLQADFDNMRKRTEQRIANEVTNGRHQILLDMLPLADHLDMAIKHADALESDGARQFLASIDATRQAFMDTLKRYGVERIADEQVPFDPERHEAVGQIPMLDVPADHVAQVLQAGYVEGERLLRPARVLVSSGNAQENAAGGEDGI